jgi:hypothetical protein
MFGLFVPATLSVSDNLAVVTPGIWKGIVLGWFIPIEAQSDAISK